MAELAPATTGLVNVAELEEMGWIAHPVDDATKQKYWKTEKWKSGYVAFRLLFEKESDIRGRMGRSQNRSLMDVDTMRFPDHVLAKLGLLSQSEYRTAQFRKIMNSIQESDDFVEKIQKSKEHARHMDRALLMNIIYECVVGDFDKPSLTNSIRGMLKFVKDFFREGTELSEFAKFCLNKMFRLVTGPYSELHFKSAAVWLGGMFWQSIITVEEFVGFNMYMIQVQPELQASVLFVCEALKAIGKLVDAGRDVKRVTGIACLYSFLFDNYSKLNSRDSFLVKDIQEMRMNGWAVPVAQEAPVVRRVQATGLDWDEIFDKYQASSSQNKTNIISLEVKELAAGSDDTKGLFTTLFRREEGFSDFVVDVVKVAILKASASDLEEFAGSFEKMFPELSETDRASSDAPKVWAVLRDLSTDEQMPLVFERFVMPFKSLAFAYTVMRSEGEPLDLESGCAICKVYEKLFDESQEQRKVNLLVRAVWHIACFYDEENCSIDDIFQGLEQDPNLLYVALGIYWAFSENSELEWPEADCPEESWPEQLKPILVLLKSGKLDKYGDICSEFVERSTSPD